MTLDRKMWKNTVGEKFRQHDDDILDSLSEETTVDSLDQMASRYEGGGGKVVFDDDGGITIDGAESAYAKKIALDWDDNSGNRVGTIYGSIGYSGTRNVLVLGSNFDNNLEGETQLSARNSSDQPVTLRLRSDASTASAALSMLTVSRALYIDETEFVVNDDGTDRDFRVEGDTKTDLLKADAGNDEVQVNGFFAPKNEAVTLASNIATITQSRITVTPESGDTDNLDTITGGTTDTRLLIMCITPVNKVITVRDATGNIFLNGSSNWVLTGSHGDTLELVKHSNGAWYQIGGSQN